MGVAKEHQYILTDAEQHALARGLGYRLEQLYAAGIASCGWEYFSRYYPPRRSYDFLRRWHSLGSLVAGCIGWHWWSRFVDAGVLTQVLYLRNNPLGGECAAAILAQRPDARVLSPGGSSKYPAFNPGTTKAEYRKLRRIQEYEEARCRPRISPTPYPPAPDAAAAGAAPMPATFDASRGDGGLQKDGDGRRREQTKGEQAQQPERRSADGWGWWT
ncbi:hypothetical protein WJX81_006794 [Elliptochloris bilobata]|uniref:Uncharacterized protein n=1 Tax=Elliptochloris bilobata TaxID=381761 RepID=A0AAW1SKD3_9CHLO